MKWIFALALVSLAAGPTKLLAFASNCTEAIEQYNSAVSEIDFTLRRYVNCVSGSDGKDDCSFEFRRLRSTHDDFETAVSDIGSYCKRR